MWNLGGTDREMHVKRGTTEKSKENCLGCNMTLGWRLPTQRLHALGLGVYKDNGSNIGGIIALQWLAVQRSLWRSNENLAYQLVDQN